MKRKAWYRLIIVCAAMLSCWNVGAQNLLDPPYATITFSDGSSVVSPGAGGVFPLVGLQPNQAVKVDVQLPPDYALQLFRIESLDGGAVLPPIIPASGNCSLAQCNVIVQLPITTTLTFTFVAGSLPGRYRVPLRDGSRALLLEFWVQDMNNPQNNPPAITAAQPDNY